MQRDEITAAKQEITNLKKLLHEQHRDGNEADKIKNELSQLKQQMAALLEKQRAGMAKMQPNKKGADPAAFSKAQEELKEAQRQLAALKNEHSKCEPPKSAGTSKQTDQVKKLGSENRRLTQDLADALAKLGVVEAAHAKCTNAHTVKIMTTSNLESDDWKEKYHKLMAENASLKKAAKKK